MGSFGIGYWRKGSKTRMMCLPYGQNSFKIGLAIYTQYQSAATSSSRERRQSSATEHSPVQGLFAPRYFRFPLRTFAPGSESSQWELSLRGAKIPRSEKSWYRIRHLRSSDVEQSANDSQKFQHLAKLQICFEVSLVYLTILEAAPTVTICDGALESVLRVIAP